MEKPKLKIWYTDFWSDFLPFNDNNYFTKLLSRKYDVEITDDNPKLLIYSVFGNQHEKWKNVRKIFYTGENKEPYGDYDLAFSFKYNEDDRHLRLPLYSYFSFEDDNFNRLHPHRYKQTPINFCSFMVGNINHGEGSKKRIEFFHKLSKYKKVLSSGRSLRNVHYPQFEGAHGVSDWREWKFKILNFEKPKYMITFENQASSGYTTEKVWDALLNGIVPIYWGNPDISRDLNEFSIINVNKFKSLNEVVSYIEFLDKYPGRFHKLIESQILILEEHFLWFKHDRILDSIINLINSKKDFTIAVNENTKIIPEPIEDIIILPEVFPVINKVEKKIIDSNGIIKPNDFFDNIYCLNLNKRYDRWANSQNRFIRENIFVTRIEGIDKSSNDITVEYNNLKIKGGGKHLYNVGSYAILKSFIKILEHGINSKSRNILIFEDDVLFHKDFASLFDEYIKQLPEDWHVIYLGGTQQTLPKGYKETVVNKYYNRPFHLDGCFAVGINGSILDSLIRGAMEYIYPLDSYIKEYMQPFHSIYNIYQTNPSLCGHDYGYSDNWDKDFSNSTIFKNRIYNKEIYI